MASGRVRCCLHRAGTPRKGGRFPGASHGAYSDGISGLAKVGPPGIWPDLSKLVMIHVGDLAAGGTEARLPMRWEAIGPGSGLFPALDADVTVTPAADEASIVTLTRLYRPPLGRCGLSGGLDDHVPAGPAGHLLTVLREALSNAARHASVSHV